MHQVSAVADYGWRGLAPARLIAYRRLTMKDVRPLDRADAETYASWFKALADGTRVQVVSLLARSGEPMTVKQIVEAVPVGQSMSPRTSSSLPTSGSCSPKIAALPAFTGSTTTASSASPPPQTSSWDGHPHPPRANPPASRRPWHLVIPPIPSRPGQPSPPVTRAWPAPPAPGSRSPTATPGPSRPAASAPPDTPTPADCPTGPCGPASSWAIRSLSQGFTREKPCWTSAPAAGSTCCCPRAGWAPGGKAYGLDGSADMITLARENATQAGVTNAGVPARPHRGHPAARRSRRRSHLQLRDQPVRRQATRTGRGVPGSAPGRTARISDVIADDGLEPAQRAEAGQRAGCSHRDPHRRRVPDLAAGQRVHQHPASPPPGALSRACGQPSSGPPGLPLRPASSSGPCGPAMPARCSPSTRPGWIPGTPASRRPHLAGMPLTGANWPLHRHVAAKVTGEVTGWVAASVVSPRPVYRGVIEHSVYVRHEAQGRRYRGRTASCPDRLCPRQPGSGPSRPGSSPRTPPASGSAGGPVSVSSESGSASAATTGTGATSLAWSAVAPSPGTDHPPPSARWVSGVMAEASERTFAAAGRRPRVKPVAGEYPVGHPVQPSAASAMSRPSRPVSSRLAKLISPSMV